MSGKRKKTPVENRKGISIEEILKIVNDIEKHDSRREECINNLEKLKSLNYLKSLSKEELEDYLYDLKQMVELNVDLMQEAVKVYNSCKAEIEEVEKALNLRI